ncbi:MAG: hypothetical protein WCA93_06595 [Acidimicrobiia bacterium]
MSHTLVPPRQAHRRSSVQVHIPRWLAVSVWLMFIALWIGFLAVQLFAPDTLGQIWTGIADLPMLVEAAVWIGFLPIVVALAVMQAGWVLWLQLIVIAACVIWTTVGLRPDRIADRS